MARRAARIFPLDTDSGVDRVLDVVLIFLALWASLTVYDEPWTSAASAAAALCSLAFIAFYRLNRGAPLRTEASRIALVWWLAFLVLVLAGFATKTSADYSRKVMLTWGLCAPLPLLAWRGLGTVYLQRARASGYGLRDAAIVGVSAIGCELAERFQNAPWMGVRVTGFYDDRSSSRLPPVERAKANVRGGFDDVVEAARSGRADLVYIALPPRAEPRIAELIRRLSDTTATVYIVYDFGGFDLLRARWSSVEDIPVMAVVSNPFDGPEGVVKRTEDVVLGGILLLCALPLMVMVALLVKLTSRGPVLFKQHRYGLNGDRILIWKFRTMKVQEDGDRIVQARRDDDRITPIGAFLRRTSLDELPQLVQVVMGTMSLVGPRPHAVAHNEQYRSLIPGYMLRHKVKPGITGWAQVNGFRGETETLDKMEGRVRHDLEYIRSWGLGLDLQILWMTLLRVWRDKNAY